MPQRRGSATDPSGAALLTMGPLVTMGAAGRVSGVARLLSGNGLVNCDRNEFIAWVPACAVPVAASPEICLRISTSSLGEANLMSVWNAVGSASIEPPVLAIAVLMAPATATT